MDFVVTKFLLFSAFQDTIYISAKTFWLAGGVRLVNARDFSLQLDGTLKFRAGRRPGLGGGMSQVEPFISHPNICPTFLRLFKKIGLYNLLRLKKMGTNRLRRFVLSRHILDFNRKRGTWIFMKLEIEPQVEVVGRNSMAMFATSTRYNLIGIRSLVLTDFGGPHRLGVSRSA